MINTLINENDKLEENEFYTNTEGTLVIQYLGFGRAKIIMTNMPIPDFTTIMNTPHTIMHYITKFERYWEVGAIVHTSTSVYRGFSFKEGVVPYWIKLDTKDE